MVSSMLYFRAYDVLSDNTTDESGSEGVKIHPKWSDARIIQEIMGTTAEGAPFRLVRQGGGMQVWGAEGKYVDLRPRTMPPASTRCPKCRSDDTQCPAHPGDNNDCLDCGHSWPPVRLYTLREMRELSRGYFFDRSSARSDRRRSVRKNYICIHRQTRHSEAAGGGFLNQFPVYAFDAAEGDFHYIGHAQNLPAFKVWADMQDPYQGQDREPIKESLRQFCGDLR